MEEFFGPDPNSTPVEDTPQTEDDLFNEISKESGLEEDKPASSNSEPTVSPVTDPVNNTPTKETDDSFTNKFLARIGIQDKNNIPFQDKSGAMYTRSWDSLTEDEQLDILSSANTDPETDLDDEEINLINQIRQSGMNPSDFINSIQKQAQDQYINENRHYDIEDWSDDEIYAIDLMQKLGEQLTEEQIEAAIEREKQDPELYAKKIENIKQEFIEKQNAAEYKMQEAVKAQQEEAFNNLSNQIIDVIKNFNTVAGRDIELDYQDQNTLASYILARDEDGNTQYALDMRTPQAIVHNAFWALYGPQFLQEAEAESARAFKRGYEQAQRDLNSQAAVEIRSITKNKPTNKYFNT